MGKLNTIQYIDMSNGFICNGAISDAKRPDNVVYESVNIDFDKIGEATTRLGQTLLGLQISDGTAMVGLYEFRDSGAGTNNQITAVNGTTLYYLSSGTWTAKRTGLTANKDADFATYLDYMFMVNGSDTTMIWDGNPSNSFLATGNALSAPIGYYIEVFKGRVWIAKSDTYPDRVWYSSLPSEDATPVITWNTSATTGDWIDISPQDGNNITGLCADKSALLVFKNNTLYRIYSTQETEPDPKIHIGTYSGRSIVKTPQGIFFHHPTGIYRYSEGNVQEISRPVSDFIKNVTVTNYSKVCGWKDDDHIYWSIGSVTIGQKSYSNVVLRYTLSSQVWTIYETPNQIRCASDYNDGTTLYRLVGDADGNVLKFNSGFTDNGTPISYSLVIGPKTLDGLWSTRKNISKISFLTTSPVTTVSYRVDDEYDNVWHDLGQTDTQLKTVDIKGNKIWFRFNGSNSGQQISIKGLEIFEATNELIG